MQRALRLLLFSVGVHGYDEYQRASVHCKDLTAAGQWPRTFDCTLNANDPDAEVQYQDSLNQTGWSKLHVRGISKGKTLDDKLRVAFAAGYVEGAMTSERTWQHWQNFLQYAYQNESSPEYVKAKDFLTANDNFVRDQIQSSLGSSDEYWQEMAIVWAQLDGLVAGNAATCGPGKCLDLNVFLFLQAEQDLDSIAPPPSEWTMESAAEYTRVRGHCSAIVRLAPNNSDVYMGHNTWTGFYSMLRLLKEYDLPVGGSADRVVQSGYYGQLYSGDDFYTLSSGLTVQETTNSLYNRTTRELIQPRCVLTWARTLLANRKAVDGPSWVKWFSPFNSGTINNQWIIAMMNRFVVNHEVPDGFLTVLEQMPGTIAWKDVSQNLRDEGFWVSYNSPFFKEIREVSGADDMEKRFGDAYSYTKNPRAKIFQRDISHATDLEKVKYLLRYNNWQHDPLSAAGYQGPSEPRAPENAIAARYDLHPWPKVRNAFGNTDAKICKASDCLALRFSAISGPTADDQPPFAWEGEWESSAHIGHPLLWNFSWVDFAAKSVELATVMI